MTLNKLLRELIALWCRVCVKYILLPSAVALTELEYFINDEPDLPDEGF